MKNSNVHFHWREEAARPFRAGVSLHSHTLHSRELLDFIQRATKDTPWLGGAIRKQEAKYRALKGRDVNLKRAWWTPPLSARQAWDLEKGQIENLLDKAPMVSITDHDNIDAALHLRVLGDIEACPVSVEWTVPFRKTFFHVGVHNMPAGEATTMMREMQEFTANPDEMRAAALLEWFAQSPESLVILNHPAWDENHIGEEAHREHATAFIEMYRPFLHAAELNGLRPWAENQKAVQLAGFAGMPLVSGGDRHGREANACVNLTNAANFAEFAEEVRRDGWSDVLFLPQYREPLRMRILENLCDILQDDPNHGMGWVRWSDRVFYLTDEGVVKSLNELWDGGFPRIVNRFVGLVNLVKHRRVRSALRLALDERQEFVL